MVDMVYESYMAAWHVLQGINIRLFKWTITIGKNGFNICFIAYIA